MSIDDYLNAFREQNIYIDNEYVRNWLFEYAATWYDVQKPTNTTRNEYLVEKMESKLRMVYEVTLQIKEEYPNNPINLDWPRLNKIPDIVENEYRSKFKGPQKIKGGRKLDEYRPEDLR